MVNYEILSPKFDSSVPHSPQTKINIEDCKSSETFPSNAKLLSTGGVRFYLQNGKVVGESSRNRFYTSIPDYNANGYFSQVDDGVSRGTFNFPSMDNWIANSTKNPPAKNDYIPRISDITSGHIDGILYVKGVTPLRLWLPNKNDTQVLDYATPTLVDAVDINTRGKVESLTENFRQKIRNNVLFNDTNQLHYDISRWVEFLDEAGFHPDKNPVYSLGVGKLRGVAAQIGKTKSLIADFDFYETAKKRISKYGLTDSEAVQAMERYIILHEIAHVYGVKGDRKGEELQGRLQSAFFSELAKEFEGTKHQRIYKILAQMGEDYAKDYSLSKVLLRSLVEDYQQEDIPISVMEHKFWHEGDELGLEGKALEKYVKARSDDTFRAFSDEDESQNSQANNPKYYSGKKGLENIIQSMKQEANNIGVDATEYISSKLARNVYLNSEASKLKNGGENSAKATKTYENVNTKEYNTNNSKKAVSIKDRTSKSYKADGKDADTRGEKEGTAKDAPKEAADASEGEAAEAA